jgi:hypothetical protein
VDTVVWFNIRDQDAGGDFGATFQSGLYFADASPKPSLAAFRFPLVVRRSGGTSRTAWMRAPVGGTLVLERQAGGSWVSVASRHVGPEQVVTIPLSGPAKSAILRARVGSETSPAIHA